MGLRTSKEAKVRLKHQLCLIMGLRDGLRTQLDTRCNQRRRSVAPVRLGARPPSGGTRHYARLYQEQKSPPGLGQGVFIWLSLKRTNNVARWYKITQSIMVIIMPFIKIGRASQHLVSIEGSGGWGSWQRLVPYIFSTLFYQGLLSVIWWS